MHQSTRIAVLGAMLAAGLAAGLATAANAQTPAPPDQTIPPAVQDQSAALPAPGPAQIAPAPDDVWHQLNDERTRVQDQTGGGDQ
jgi:hypothetical protein